VEPVEAIVPRFMTAAMSLGALSPEAQQVLAVAMNRMGAKSNSGEGGEPPDLHWKVLPGGDRPGNRVKQVASARFGVTADDLAQGHYTPQFVQLMAFEAERARDYYQRAWAALPGADARRLFAAEIMGRTYFALLRAIEARRFDVFGGRVALPAVRRVAIALRCWLASRWSRQ